MKHRILCEHCLTERMSGEKHPVAKCLVGMRELLTYHEQRTRELRGAIALHEALEGGRDA